MKDLVSVAIAKLKQFKRPFLFIIFFIHFIDMCFGVY